MGPINVPEIVRETLYVKMFCRILLIGYVSQKNIYINWIFGDFFSPFLEGIGYL